MQTPQFQLHAEIEDRHWWFVARRQILGAIIDSVLPPGATIVDVGCGTGANLAGLAGRYECVGIDASSEAVRLASCRFPGVRFLHGPAPRDLGGIMDRARLILLTDVLEHVADDFALFSELLAAARPGAYFLVTVPADPLLWSEHDRSFGHYRRYDMQRFEQIWHGLAVTPVFASYFNSRLYGVVKTIRRYNRWRGRTGGAAGTDFVLPGPLTNHLLSRFFAGERHRLARMAQGEPLAPYRVGVSLIALLRREVGPVERRLKPLNLAGDDYDPAAELVTADA
jgi:SAM-dependent methyltransferase